MSKSPIEKLRGLAPVAFAAIPLLVVLDTAALAQGNSERNAYFGETHVHTSWSFDAYIFGNHITGPADAYKYAKGEPIKHPLGYDVKITTPLDWMPLMARVCVRRMRPSEVWRRPCNPPRTRFS